MKRSVCALGLILLLAPAMLAQTSPLPPKKVIGPTKVAITLAWDPNIETDLAGYKVYYGTASGKYGAPVDVGNRTIYTLFGFAGGSTYFFAVTAYNTALEESGYSNEVYATVLPQLPNPAPPVTGPMVVSLTATTVELSWKTNEPATARIEYQYAGGPFTSLVIDTAAVTDHYVRIATLTPGQVYQYTVINTVGTLELRATGSFKTK